MWAAAAAAGLRDAGAAGGAVALKHYNWPAWRLPQRPPYLPCPLPGCACLCAYLCANLPSAAPACRRWIKERKRSFPTAESLARKAAEADARRERGELDPARCHACLPACLPASRFECLPADAQVCVMWCCGVSWQLLAFNRQTPMPCMLCMLCYTDILLSGASGSSAWPQSWRSRAPWG